MKKIILLITITLSIAKFTIAQKSEKYLNERATKFTKEITDYIGNVTPELTQQIFDINKSVTIQFDSLKALHLESNEYKPAARNIFKYRDEELKKVLSKKQFDDFMLLQAEKRDAYLKKKEEKSKEKKEDKTEDKTEQKSEKKSEKKKEFLNSTKNFKDSISTK